MVDIAAGLPFPLGLAVTGSSSASAVGAVSYDFSFGGQGFISGASDTRPYSRSLVAIRKDQFDSAHEVGEQSLANWWMRSEDTFVGGEGLTYQDPDEVSVANLQNRHTIQYGHGVGVNPWTQGKMTLLRQTGQRVADATGADHYVQGWDNAGAANFWSAYSTNLKSDDGTTTTTVTYGGVNAITSLATDGTRYFVTDSVGLWSGTGAGAGTKLWNTGSASSVCAWVKGRLMAGIGNKLYELVGGAPPTLPTATFTHLNSAWTWTCFAEGTNAIYAAGRAGAVSQIYKLTMDNTGAIPALASGGQTAAQLPFGESVLSMYCYLGTFIGIGTNRGFRVGQIDGDGNIAYGPLIVLNADGVRAIAAYDRFFFFGHTNGIDGFSGLCRVDLGQPIYDNGTTASLRFAYATDLQTHLTGRVTGVTNFGATDQMVIGQVSHGAYLEHASNLEPAGYMLTGKIRYNTLEPKLFKFLTVRAPSVIKGTLSASTIGPDGLVVPVFSISQGTTGSAITDIAINGPVSPVEYISVRLDFTRSATDATTGPEVNGYQLKALPGATRQRQFIVPLLCFDLEKDGNNQWDGHEGRCLDRLEAFESLAQRGDSFTFSDLHQNRSYLVIVDDYQFEQKAAPGNNTNGYGGYLTVQLHTVADVINS